MQIGEIATEIQTGVPFRPFGSFTFDVSRLRVDRLAERHPRAPARNRL